MLYPIFYSANIQSKFVRMGTDVNTQSKKQNHQDPMAIMHELGIEPTPHNYELFFAYCEDLNPSLNNALRPYIEDGAKWSEAEGKALHTKHIADDRLAKVLGATTEGVSKELKLAMQVLAETGKDAANYEKILIGAGGDLQKVADPRSIRDIVDHLVAETANMQERSRALEKKLAETNEQVETLQTNLDQVKIEAMTDSLSGLSNRKRFDEVLREESKNAHKSGEPMALVLCDIDHFKRFNDTWGHQTGDQIIRFVSSTLKRHVAKHHMPARYGGEEFALIMPETEMSSAIEIAEIIRTKIERKKLVRKSTNEDLGRVTISMGVAMLKETDEVEDIIERADKALYTSKQNGRNRLSTEDEIVPNVAA